MTTIKIREKKQYDIENTLVKNSLPHGLCLFQSSEYAGRKGRKPVNITKKPTHKARRTL
jgi:hypothetical protein